MDIHRFIRENDLSQYLTSSYEDAKFCIYVRDYMCDIPRLGLINRNTEDGVRIWASWVNYDEDMFWGRREFPISRTFIFKDMDANHVFLLDPNEKAVETPQVGDKVGCFLQFQQRILQVYT